jgi:Cu+-exporting ATPase
VGDRIRVLPDEVIPVDGRLVEGEAAIDESMLTGEPLPPRRTVDDAVWGGTLVREGTIVVEATGVGRDTAVGRIVVAVERAQLGKTNMQRIADRVAGVFVPIVLVLAVATVLGWVIVPGLVGRASPGWGWALQCAVAVLVIACPCAMGLATPMAVLVATGKAASAGILVRNPAALEAVGQVNAIVFDKTGTLTTGKPKVEAAHFDGEAAGQNPVEILRLAASAERFSTHPLARSLAAHAESQGLRLEDPANFETFAGRGVRATVNGHAVLVGSPALLAEHGVTLAPLDAKIGELAGRGLTVAAIAIDGRPAGVVAYADSLREHAAATVATLKSFGCAVYLFTGDGEFTARRVAGEVGIGEFFGGMRPEEKLAGVERLRAAGRIVAFVGDGVNDAPALAAADAGIAFAAGTDVANEAAEMTLVGSDIRAVGRAVELARRSVRIIRQNLFWAFFYNFLALPLAALGKIPPSWAAGAMMLSSVTVVLNSLRLRRR